MHGNYPEPDQTVTRILRQYGVSTPSKISDSIKDGRLRTRDDPGDAQVISTDFHCPYAEEMLAAHLLDIMSSSDRENWMYTTRGGRVISPSTTEETLFSMTMLAGRHDGEIVYLKRPISDIMSQTQRESISTRALAVVRRVTKDLAEAPARVWGQSTASGARIPLRVSERPALIVASTLRRNAQAAAALWIAFEKDASSRQLIRNQGKGLRNVDCLENMTRGAFWVQHDGESIYLPAFTPYTMVTLSAGYQLCYECHPSRGLHLDDRLRGGCTAAIVRGEPDAQQRLLDDLLARLSLGLAAARCIAPVWLESLAWFKPCLQQTPMVWEQVKRAWEVHIDSNSACVFCETLWGNLTVFLHVATSEHVEAHMRGCSPHWDRLQTQEPAPRQKVMVGRTKRPRRVVESDSDERSYILDLSRSFELGPGPEQGFSTRR